MKELEFVKVYDIKSLLSRHNLTSHGGRRSSEIVLPQERFQTALELQTDFSTSPIIRQSSSNKTLGQRLAVRFETDLNSGHNRERPKSEKYDADRGRSMSIKSDSVLLKRRNSFMSGSKLNKRRASVKSTSHLGKRRGSAFVNSYNTQDSGVFVEVSRWSIIVYSQWAHNIKMTSYQRRCDVITSHRR